MNWPFLIIFGIAAVALVIFLIVRNLKDEREFEGDLKNDYPKIKDEKHDIETEEPLK